MCSERIRERAKRLRKVKNESFDHNLYNSNGKCMEFSKLIIHLLSVH